MTRQAGGEGQLKGPRLSVVILEYLSGQQLRDCVRSFKALSADIEIIISSNSDYDEETRSRLTEEFAGESLLFNPLNGGFAYGMNRGLERADGDYIIICNQDVEVLGGIMEMACYMKANPSAGVLGPLLKSRTGIVQDSFRRYVSLPRLLQRNVRRLLHPSSMSYDYRAGSEPLNTDWLSGAFIMLSREALDIVGGFDEGYFLYAEDVDLCTRMRLAAYDVQLFPEAVVLYEGSRRARRVLNRNFLFFISSHFRLWRKFGFFATPASAPGRMADNPGLSSDLKENDVQL